MCTPVCQSIGVFLSFLADLHTHANQRTPFPFKAFNISGRISSSPAAFPVFNPRMAAAISVNVKTTSFLKSMVLHVSVGIAFIGFNKSSKYSIQRETIFFSSRKMLPEKSLMEVVVFKLFPRNRLMVCQNTLFVDQ